MHGVILKALQDYVISEYGREAWEEVQARADVEEKVYVPVTVYPDEDVYELATAAGEVTGKGARQVLCDYGTYVVQPLVSMYDIHIDDDWGALALIANIEQYHTSLRTRDMVEVTTPRVRSEWLDDDEELVRITYDSDRHLCDVARGAIMGVSRYFGDQLAFEEQTCMLEGDDACRFVISRDEQQVTAHVHDASTDPGVTGEGDDRLARGD
ncbi:heme NO-binding domain-containing protein [Haloarchaeobius amylolyticus]|uniref:heme NO-binding domain-containing protein n=1 Tax=Haloarchaeobius amylolyticus TaxID=1198296 RepID=UPI002270F714|nr:heme NO-binding domain-containing protein [Haloarchaeobius amylolyticus]